MKKTKLILTVFALIFVLSGCVKYNGSMDIKKDKSMQFDTIYAVNESMLEGEELLDEEQKKSIEKQGYTITDYSQDNMKGVTLNKNIKNIDDVSSKENVVFNLSSMFDEKEQSNTIFKVEKGFFKNTYTAEFILDSDSGLNNGTTTEDSMGDESLENEDFSNYLNMMSDLEMTFVVKLPYAAISSNATTKSSDNKTLTWNLLDDGNSENKNEDESEDEIVLNDETATDNNEEDQKVKFKFEIYNLTNIYICAGVIAFLIVVAIISSISKNKKPKPIIPPQYAEPVPKPQPFQESVMNVKQPEIIQGSEINANQSISGFVNQTNDIQNSNVVLNSVVPQGLINDQLTTISNQPTVNMSNIDVPPMEPVGFESPQMPTINNNVEEPSLETLSLGNDFNDLNQQSNQNNTFSQ